MRLLILVLALSWILYPALGLAIPAAVDPIDIGLGARPMALGRAYLTREDINSLFVNPAGIAGLSSWQFSSTYSNFLGDVSYIMLGGAYPTDFGTLGLGYAGASVGNIPVTLGYDDQTGEPIIMYDTYQDRVMLLSYALDMENVLPTVKGLKLGTSLKFFQQGYTASAESATGFDADIGLQYKPLPWLTLGIGQRDTIPCTMGGKITWQDGTEERLPSLTRIGVGASLLEDKLYIEGGVDFRIGMSGRPTPLHGGIEWMPMEVLALRLGVDQEILPPVGGVGSATLNSNLTAGVGLKYSGFGFDYAYHTYHGIPEHTTHFFTMSYAPPPPVPPPPPLPPSIVLSCSVWPDTIVFPVETLGTFPDIKGNFAEHCIERLAGLNVVNGRPDGRFYPWDPVTKLEFSKMLLRTWKLKRVTNIVLLTYGLEGEEEALSISVELQDEQGKFIKTLVQSKLTPAGTYNVEWDGSDFEGERVRDGTYTYIVTLEKEGKVLKECKGTITVASLQLIYRELEIGESSFQDVRRPHWGAGIVKNAVEAGLVDGETPEFFRPNKQFTRLEVAVAIAKAMVLEGVELEVGEELPYKDARKIPYQFKNYIGLWEKYFGTGAEYFYPQKVITRAETAAMLDRYLNYKIGKLLKERLVIPEVLLTPAELFVRETLNIKVRVPLWTESYRVAVVFGPGRKVDLVQDADKNWVGSYTIPLDTPPGVYWAKIYIKARKVEFPYQEIQYQVFK